jgi:diguanylate cyclase (GGDEF)-like protein
MDTPAGVRSPVPDPNLPSYRVLVIDDNPSIHADFRKVLEPDDDSEVLSTLESQLFGEQPKHSRRPQFDIDSAHQGHEGVEMVCLAVTDGRPYAMAFVDMRMPPGLDGLKTVELLWTADPNLQIVICSAHSDYDWPEVVERLNHSDKLLVLRKPAEPIEILQCAAALTRKWSNERLIRDQMQRLEQTIDARTQGLEAATRQLRHLATHDALTGLPNRALLDDRLTQAAARADRDDRPFALLVCDLDRFKLVNDSLGHGAGDELLQEVARRLSSLVPPTDTLARLGSDQFVVLMTSLNHPDEAKHLAMRAIVALQSPVRIAGIDVHTSPSLGIAYYPSDAKTVGALLANAEAAMHSAKRRARGSFQCFEGGMIGGLEERVKLESELHQAIAQQQFVLYYQPKVHTGTGAVTSAEALIRWNHPTRGLLSPDIFIPIAEECGLIDAIGEWVVGEACRQARAWHDGGLGPMRISINLSASQFRGGGLVAKVRRALEEASLESRYLEVELTESTVMSDPEESIAILQQLSAMGVLVSVDDFGTGYSSMSYLRRLPIDNLKIDRVFINEIATRPEDASIVRAIVSLAHSLRLKVIAEGVESAAQLDFLRAVGCDEYQGYHFCRPLPAQEFERTVREKRAQPGARTEVEAAPSKLAARRGR